MGRHAIIAIALSTCILAGCKQRSASVAPAGEGPAGRDTAPPASTQRATAPTQPATPGRAVANPQPNSGEVIIGGTGPGSPGTR
jgi:hypothetical protein